MVSRKIDVRKNRYVGKWTSRKKGCQEECTLLRMGTKENGYLEKKWIVILMRINVSENVCQGEWTEMGIYLCTMDMKKYLY